MKPPLDAAQQARAVDRSASSVMSFNDRRPAYKSSIPDAVFRIGKLLDVSTEKWKQIATAFVPQGVSCDSAKMTSHARQASLGNPLALENGTGASHEAATSSSASVGATRHRVHQRRQARFLLRSGEVTIPTRVS